MCDEFCGPALAAWLAQGTGGTAGRLRAWERARNRVLLLPAGVRWDAVRVPERPGHEVHARLQDSTAPLGPVMWDRRCGLLYFLVPPHGEDVWAPLGLRRLTLGSWLAARDPRRAAPHPAVWLYPRDGVRLTSPAFLLIACLEVLGAGTRARQRLPAPLG